ncbi:multidrug effflux MFS transporter [Polluticaenibacter yanchengensis]|uniref:Multidrug effflux MFS transporter n=1 Tax=Polluticaenibacter yanchengensis TaxID=3014562 RepID=A0ABT4UEP9_9BACT|nr:multidrug effflux MFS transporter [Chitinophagaceae bacterium LY-5]
MQNNSKKQKTIILIILGLLSALGPFSIDMYLPGFNGIAQSLNTDVAHVSLSLSSFFIGISVGQFLYGPLLDKYGRLKILYIGFAIFIVASLLCAISTSVEMLIGLRFFQAIGSCVGMVASRAMVRDLYPVSESARVFSRLMLVVGISPIIAPTVGGIVAAHFGWQVIFVILAAMGLLIVSLVKLNMQETIVPNKDYSLKPGFILSEFIGIFKDPQFSKFALTSGISAAGLYAYIAGSPALFVKRLGTTEQQYGWFFAVIALGIISATQINTLLLKRFKTYNIAAVALSCQLLVGFILIALAHFHVLNIPLAISFLCLFLMCQGFTFANTSALAMAKFPHKAGMASALMGGIQMGAGALTSAIVSILSKNSNTPMMIVMSSCAGIALFFALRGKRLIERNNKTANLESY